MASRRRRFGRIVAAALLALPLLAAGPCVQIAQEAPIAGFFNALTAVLEQLIQERMGVTGSTVQTTGTDAASQDTGP